MAAFYLPFLFMIGIYLRIYHIARTRIRMHRFKERKRRPALCGTLDDNSDVAQTRELVERTRDPSINRHAPLAPQVSAASAVSAISHQTTPNNNSGSVRRTGSRYEPIHRTNCIASNAAQRGESHCRQEQSDSPERKPLDMSLNIDLETVNRALGISESARPPITVNPIAVVIDEFTSQAIYEARDCPDSFLEVELRPLEEKAVIVNHNSCSHKSEGAIPEAPIQVNSVRDDDVPLPKQVPDAPDFRALEDNTPDVADGRMNRFESSDTLQTPIINRRIASNENIHSFRPTTQVSNSISVSHNNINNHHEGSNGFAGRSSISRKLSSNVCGIAKDMRHTHFDPHPQITQTPIAQSAASTPNSVSKFAFNKENSPQIHVVPPKKKTSGLLARMSLRASALTAAKLKPKKRLQRQLSSTSMDECSEAPQSSSGSLPDVSTARPSCAGLEGLSPRSIRRTASNRSRPNGSFRATDPALSLSLLHGTTQLAAHVHNTLMVKSSGSDPHPRPKSPRHLSTTDSPQIKQQEQSRPRAATADPLSNPNALADGVANGNGSPLVRTRGKHVNKDIRQKMISKRERRAVRTVVVVTSAFCICWLPFFLFALLSPWCDHFGKKFCGIPEYVIVILNWLGYLNSLINPLIYTTVL